MAYVNKEYHTKGDNLIYPMLGLSYDKMIEDKISKGCYLYWNNTNESINEYQCIIHYEWENEQEKAAFERYEKYILANYYVSGIYKVENGCVYIFNLIDYMQSIDTIIEGKYSKLSDKCKLTILRYYGMTASKKPLENKPIHMILYPEYYFEKVAEELDISEETLKQMGELWSIIDEENEHLYVELSEE